MDLRAIASTEPWQWPENAGEVIRGVLNDPGASGGDRVLAAKLAGDSVVVNDQIVEDLLAVIQNETEPEELRAAAAIALGPALDLADSEQFDGFADSPISEVGFERARSILRKVVQDQKVPKLVRRRAFEGAVRSPQDWQKEFIGDAYAKDDRDWKLTAVFAMSYVQGFDAQIRESLHSDDDEILFEAIRAAGASEIQWAWPRVKKILKEERSDKALLIAAMEAGATIRPKEALPLLHELSDSDDEEIADVAQMQITLAQPVDDEDDDLF